MSKPKELSASPAMRDIWKKAKADAAKKAKSLKKQKECKAFEDELIKLKLALGPSLDKWDKLYPNLEKMNKQEEHIEGIIIKYAKKVEDEREKNTLPDSVLDEFELGLVAVKDELGKRSKIATEYISDSLELGIEASLEMDKKKDKLTPITIFKLPNAGRLILEQLTTEEKEIIRIEDLNIEVILSEVDVLLKLRETANARQKIADAANHSQLIEDIVEACRLSIEDFKRNPTEQQEREEVQELEKAIENAIKAAVGRAAVEVYRLAKVRSAYRNYQIKTGVSITLNVAGLIGGVASLALAPLTFGPSIVLSAVALTKGAVSLGVTLGKASLSAEEAMGRLEERVAELIKRYDAAHENEVGAREVLSNTANALLPTFFNTIKECVGDCEQAERKIDGLEVKAEEASVLLDAILEKQEKIKKGLLKWQEENLKFDLTDKQVKLIQKLIDAAEDNVLEVHKQIKSLIKLNKRVAKCREDHEKLSQSVRTLAASEPTWSKVTNVFVPIVIGIGYTIGTSPAIPGPDAYEFAKTGKMISDIAGTVAGSADNLKTVTEEAMSVFGKK